MVSLKCALAHWGTLGTPWDRSEAAVDGSRAWGEGWKPLLLFASGS